MSQYACLSFLYCSLLFFSFGFNPLISVYTFISELYVIIYPSHLIISSLTTKPSIFIFFPFSSLFSLLLFSIFSTFLFYYHGISFYLTFVSSYRTSSFFISLLSSSLLSTLLYSSLFPTCIYPTFISTPFTTIHSFRLLLIYSISIDRSLSISSISIQSLHFSDFTADFFAKKKLSMKIL